MPWIAQVPLQMFFAASNFTAQEDAATECGFIETLTVDNEQCFSPAIALALFAATRPIKTIET